MSFLIRTAFWFSLVLLALPLGGPGGTDGQRSVNAFEAVVAAGEAVSDIAGMCERKPAVCETGRSAISTIGVRAREVSRIAYEALEQQPGLSEADTDPSATVETGLVNMDSIATGSVPIPTARVEPSGATLR